MFNRKTRVALALVGVTALVLLAGGMAVASNTGFKINKSLAPALPAPGNPQAGNNWLSIPYFNPYGNFGAFCTQVGLVSTGLGTHASAVVVDPVTGVTSAPVSCGTPAANTLLITAGRGIRVRNTPAAQTGTPSSIIIVGSHDPSLAITVPKSGAGTAGDFWFAVPYHTTAANANDLCLSSGFSSSGLSKATITRLDPVTGVQAAPVQCGTAGATSFILTLGEAIKVREPNGPLTFNPAHF
jgi:hypothetical protein